MRGARNKDLEEGIEGGNCREDLYHRLSVIVLNVPPLKDRKDDIPLLVEKFLTDIAKEYGDKKKDIEKGAITQLQTHDWSGNIRELRNVVERLIIMSGNPINKADVEKYL